MLPAEIQIETIARDVISAVTSALRPGPMIGCPVLGTILLPVVVALPTAVAEPSALLLPASGLLLRALGLRRCALPGPFLRLRKW
jgi:hypothetical protein